ncbi:MAG: DUF3365 domain-containing protein [Planctomycetaceae bacterium]|nr:DUF3365 domain-containing protein [Planctomycetales bacterium]MCB9924187.1 DUF3365 domain-containing protein [Planctomycetaceae bacterium]
MNRLKQFALAALCVALAIAITWQGPNTATAQDKAKKKDVALERTRDTVKMLDDVYKTAVVLITTHYVNDSDDLPAGSAAIALFEAIGKKGWHEVRLLDASGEPIEEKNSPKDEFEKAAVNQLKAGESWHEEVIKKDGKRFLRAATPIPVVLDKCVMCHENYKAAKKGEPIGALSYTIPIK